MLRALSALCLALLPASTFAQEGTIITASNQSINAKDIALATESGELTASFTAANGRRQTLKALDLVEIALRTAPIAPPAGPAAVEITLSTGDVLVGSAGPKSDEGIHLASKVFGNPLLKFEQLHHILFPAQSRHLPKRLPEKGEIDDMIYTVTGDRGLGTILSLSADGLLFHSKVSQREKSLPLNEITGIWFSQPKVPASPAGLYSTVLTSDGSSVSGVIQSFTKEGLALKDLFGTSHTIASDAVSGIYMKNGRVIYLSDLAPSGVEENANYISAPQKLASDLECPFRKDRSALQGKLVLGNAEHRKGLGVHAHSALAYALDGKFKRFQGVFGVDRGALESALVAGEVWVDGKQVKRVSVARKDAPQELDIDVSGAKELKIVATWADPNHTQSCWAGWGSARLIR